MNRSPEANLCLHGAVIMFAAFVSGAMIGAAAFNQVSGSVEDWKLAHMEALINAILLFAVAGASSRITLRPIQGRIAAYCLIGMAYCNTVFGYMRGLTGALGYRFGDSLANDIMTFAGMLGVPLGVIAFAIILIGAFNSRQLSPSEP